MSRRDVTQCSVTAGAVGDEVRLILVIGHGAIGTLDAADSDSLVDQGGLRILARDHSPGGTLAKPVAAASSTSSMVVGRFELS